MNARYALRRAKLALIYPRSFHAPFEWNCEPAGLRKLTGRAGFQSGAVVWTGAFWDPSYRRFLKSNVDLVAPQNELKAYSILDGRSCRLAGGGPPRLRFQQGDRLVRWARNNGLKVRGHALVYHACTPDWFFREGYDPEGAPCSRETAMDRTKSYIEQVIVHYEKKFPGVVTCWDAVNEPVGEFPGEYDEDDALKRRTSRNGVRNVFVDALGLDYAAMCCRWARDAVEKLGADIDLYLNDFNLYDLKKLRTELALAEHINKTEPAGRRLIDGIGLQGYLGPVGQQEYCLDPGKLRGLRDAVLLCSEAGYDAQITELTVRSYVQEDEDRHADYCAELYKMLAETAGTPGSRLRAVTVWGMRDTKRNTAERLAGEDADETWNPFGGFLDQDGRPKKAYERILGALGELTDGGTQTGGG